MDKDRLVGYVDTVNRSLEVDISRTSSIRDRTTELAELSKDELEIRAATVYVEARMIGEALMEAPVNAVFSNRILDKGGEKIESREIMLGRLGTFHLDSDVTEPGGYGMSLIGTDRHRMRGAYPYNKIKTVARVPSPDKAGTMAYDLLELARAEESLETLRVIVQAAGVEVAASAAATD